MRDELAERLLAAVMSWTPGDVARERPRLQALAAFKYDEYQQFSPGLRFVESFARWLGQFTPAERPTAYEFVLDRLVFVSSEEMSHLVSMVFADVVQPYLFRRVAVERGTEPWRVADLATSQAYRVRKRQTLFLGLSDGARLDTFRRATPTLSNEQVYQTYEIPDQRVDSLRRELRRDLDRIDAEEEVDQFRTVVLLDDFGGTGDTYGGKIRRVVKSLRDPQSAMYGLTTPDAEMIAVVYLATERARTKLRDVAAELAEFPIRIEVVHIFPDSIRLEPMKEPFSAIVDRYLDWEQDEHFAKGGSTDAKYGYGGCGLPVVLTHNTPNDSLFLLWTSKAQLTGLFPRIDRHKEIA